MITCLYIPDFPAWAFEQAAAGYIDGKRVSTSPLAVVAAGYIVSANRLARRAGVVPGITVARAQSLLPGLRTHFRDGDIEEAVWEETLLLVNQITPFLEKAAPPFVYFRSDLDETRELVKRLRAKAGSAPSRSIARLASVRAAAGNVLALPRRVVQTFLTRFPVDSLDELNFEEDLIDQLKLFGYRSLGAVHRLSPRHLEAQFGSEGSRLFSILHPEDGEPIKLFEPPPTINCSLELDQPLTEPGELLPVLAYLIRLASQRLQGQLAQRVKVSAAFHGSPALSGSSRILGTATDKPQSLMRAASLLLQRLPGLGKQVESIQLQLGALRYAQPLQTTLFRERPSPYSAIKAVHRRHPGLIKKAVLQPGAIFTDEFVRLEPFDEPKARKGGKNSTARGGR